MRRIYITDEVRQIAEDYSNSLFASKGKRFKYPINNLTELANKIRGKDKIEYKKYVLSIIDNYHDILKLEPKSFESYRAEHFNMLNEKQLSVKSIIREGKAFHEEIVKCMRYDEVQKSEIRPFMKKLGIKACVYCNAAYTSLTDDKSATYQLDHSYPKSIYPFLCTSFFNLQPSCMHCNQRKSKNNDYIYSMYTEDPNGVDPFYFSIERKSLIKYMLNHNSDILKFELKSKVDQEANIHQEFFGINALYSQFTDAAEDVLWKAMIYNQTYRNQLSKSFKKLFPYNMDEFKRFYLGFYPDSKDVNKRPLTLLMQGIAKDLGLE